MSGPTRPKHWSQTLKSSRISRFFQALALAGVCCAGITCRTANSSRVVLTFWALGAEGERVQELMPEFERRHPDIQVKVQAIPWTAAHEKLLTAYAGQSTPDLSQLGNTWIPELAALNAIEPLANRLDSSSTVQKSDYFLGIWDTNIVGDLLYGIPWYVDTRVLFYRKDILKRASYSEPPKSWDEWMEVAMKIRASNEGREEFAILLPTNNEWAPQVILGLQTNSSLLRDGDRYGGFSGPEFTRGFQFFVEFFKRQLAPASVTRMRDVYQGFASGYFAMYITGPWNVGEFRKRLPSALSDQWMTAPLPAPDLRSYPGVSLAGGSSFVVFRKSSHKREAWKLIEYLSEPQVQVRFYELTGDLPARRSSWTDSVLSSDKFLQAFRIQLENVKPMPRIPEWEQIAMKLQQYGELAALGRMTIPNALAALDGDVNTILEKRRWLLDNK